jgi:hypothetical protein
MLRSSRTPETFLRKALAPVSKNSTAASVRAREGYWTHQETSMKLELKNVCAVESGDYYQVSFDDDDTDDVDYDGPYLLLQRQFEDPDGGICYVEAHDEEYCGHFRLKRAHLTNSSFVIELQRKRSAIIEVRFSATRATFKELLRILQIMIPNLEVENAV